MASSHTLGSGLGEFNCGSKWLGEGSWGSK